jgi:hypothetical protein
VGILAIVVAAVLVLGIVLMVKAVQGIREDMSAPAPEPTTTEAAAPGPEASEGSGACPPDSVRLAASTDEDEYEDGEEPELTIEVTNGHDADCIIDVGEAHQEFVIERDGDTVWSSLYCAATGEDDEAATNPLVFPAQSSKKASLTWPRIPVDDECRQTDESFPAGEYALVVKLGETESEPARFSLVEEAGDGTSEPAPDDPDAQEEGSAGEDTADEDAADAGTADEDSADDSADG